MDCLIDMQEIPSGSVDLIICDPPYGTIKGIGKSTDIFKNWIGYEMNTEFYNRALKRINETMRTPTLF